MAPKIPLAAYCRALTLGRKAGEMGVRTNRGISMRNLQYLKTIVGAALLLATASAAAQYVWVDEKGARNYSDRPPPPGVPANKILKAPRGMEQIMAAVAPPATAPATPSAAVRPGAAPAAPGPAGTALSANATLAEREEDYRKRRQASDEKAKKDAETARLAASNKQACDAARASRAKLDSGVRLQAQGSVNPREVMGDLERSAALARANQTIAACGSN